MNDAILNFCLGEHCPNRIEEPEKIIYAGDENALNTTVFQNVEHRCPEFHALISTHPDELTQTAVSALSFLAGKQLAGNSACCGFPFRSAERITLPNRHWDGREK